MNIYAWRFAYFAAAVHDKMQITATESETAVLRPVHTGSRIRILCIRKQATLLPETATKYPSFRIQSILVWDSGTSVDMP